MARNLLKRYKNVEEYNRVKCTLDIRQISLINTYKETKYGPENYTITSVYKVRNTSNNIKLFNNTTLVNSINKMYINGIEVEPTNDFQFDKYGNATIECEFCNLTSIPNSSFSNCYSLTNITIPNSVTSIGDAAFYGCSSLSSIEIPNSVNSIGTSVFTNCYSLTSITIPNSVTSIGTSTFSYCYSLTSIEIPNSVKSIGNQAFTNCSSLTNITIPNSVTSIGESAFSYCYSLTNITILSGVTSISYCAFSSCRSLTNITIPNGVKSISDRAFEYCSSLSSIEIPNSVTSIGNQAFYQCSSLSSIEIPSGVTSIGANTFRECYSLTSITIPNSVKSIGGSAFYQCYSLSEITCLAETAPTIESSTFSNVYKNGVLNIPNGSDYSSWLSTSNYYLGTYNWVGVKLQDSYDFKVNFITNGVRVESPYNSLTINGIDGVKQDDNSYLFSGIQIVDNIYEFDLVADGEIIDTVDVKHNNKWIVVSDNSSILSCIYNSCQNCTLYNRSDLTYSDAYVDGEYVGALSSSYTFNSIGEHIIQYSGVTSIGNQAFINCSSLSEITIGNSVTSIGNYAFSGCSSLTIITIPNSVTSIGNYVFTNCYLLTSIDIPNSVTSIGANTFRECYSLTSITIPNSVKSIGTSVFTNCYSLTSITIPNSVTSIGNQAFYYCYLLTSIDMPNSVTSISTSAFTNCYSLTNITIPNGVKSIGTSAFYGCYSLSEINMPDSVKSIGNQAFYQCRSLSSIEIPSGVTSIGNQAFYGCSSLSSINMLNSVTSIGNQAFYQCRSLSSIEIPSGVTSIGNQAFTNCSSLSEITCLAETAPTVSSNTFSNISSVGVLYYPGLNSSYDTWKSYLPNWDFISLYTPQECTNLVISAENVNGRATSTTISYTATTNGVDGNGNLVNGVELTGTTISESFSQNTDTENEVIRTITFEYMGLTASTTITQGVWFDQYYSIDLNNQWQLSSTIANPDSNTYDGVYESYRNKGVNNSAAICTITINGYENFKLYVRSYAESSYDFVVVSNLDCTLSSGVTSTTNANVKMTTSGKQQSGTAISNYTLVEFSGIDEGLHTIQVMYRKDSSGNSYDDKGYLLIPKEQ